MAGARPTILLVEDSPDVRLLMSVALSAQGYEIAEAEDGASALTWLNRHGPPSLIILDVRMPGMSGYQFRAEQARDPSLRDIPVVVYSAEHDMNGLRESLAADAYLSKSAPLATLVSTVRSFVC